MPVSHEKRGEGQGDDEADEAEQSAPYRQGEQQDGGVQSHGLAHDFRSDNHIGDDLHNAEYADDQSEDKQKVLTSAGCLEHRQKGAGDESEGVKIGHEVEDADEDAHADGHGEIDDGEPDAEHDAHAQGHKALPTDVVVEFPGHVLAQVAPERALLHGEDPYPVFREILIVEQNEEHI